ncbi:MAG TPA: metal-dependent transcriptional regulator [Gaiellaceae bacterium]|nr:metal-dependent transcriptional regulator [Gaiellaceae bacterium]
MPTQPIQDYLKAIYELCEEEGRVTTTALARRMDVSAPSATSMIKRLAELGLVRHEPYQGVALEPGGEQLALEMIRHHRLVEQFLAQVLGVPWDEVHDEAERWEHVLSEDVEDRIDEVLGFPTSDPHGSPIPARDGSIVRPESVPLAELEPGQSAVVAEVSDRDAAVLRYLGRVGLVPRAEVSVLEAEPFDGPLTLDVAGRRQVLDRELARELLVTEVRAA